MPAPAPTDCRPSRSALFGWAAAEPRPFLASLLLVGLVAAAYANSLHGAFLWDDLPTLVDNPALGRIAPGFGRPAAITTASGRPLVGLSLALNLRLGGLNPAGFHVVNVAIHAAATLALFGFVRRLARLPRLAGRFARDATGLAFCVAAIWALHPLQTQAVAYVIQRAEALMGLCYLLTLYLFLRSADSNRPGRWRALAVASCALGMTAKEVMVSAPVVVLLLDRTFLAGSFRRALAAKRRFYAALFGTWLVLLWLVAALGGNRGGSTGGFSAHAAWTAYWLTQLPAVATYLKLAFLPRPLIFQYGAFWLPSAAAALPAALVVAPPLALTVFALVRRPEAGFLGFWFFSILAVTSLVPGTVDMIVEYRMYLALAPLWILVAAGLYRWLGRSALPALGAAALVFGALTVARNRDYRSPLTLWADNVAKRPGNALARYNLAVALLREPGRAAEARAQLEEAVRLQPDLAGAHYNLALLLSRQPGREDAAIAHYQTALRIAPGYSQAHNNLAVLLYQRGRSDEALRHLELAVQSDPGNRSAWINLVQVLEDLARPADAVAASRAFVGHCPDAPEAHFCLARALAVDPRTRPQARDELAKTLALDPGFPGAKPLLDHLQAEGD